MTIKDVLNHVLVSNPDNAVGFEQFLKETGAAIRTAYKGSEAAKALFNSLVLNGEMLTINYQPGAADSGDSLGSLTINIDHTYNRYFLGSDGVFHHFDYIRVLMHEASHAIVATSDPLWDLPYNSHQRLVAVRNPSFDFNGSAVTAENSIMDELGDNWERGSYFNAWTSGTYYGVSNFTFGTSVDQAIIIDQLKLPKSILSMEHRLDTDDLILGGNKDDTICGGGGDDFLWGFFGSDSLEGGAGNDYLSGDNNKDELIGGENDDKLFGGFGNDKLVGDAGNDSLDGGTDIDKMIGGTGDDMYFVDNVKDVVTEIVDEGTDTVILTHGGNFTFSDVEFVQLGDGVKSANLALKFGKPESLLTVSGNSESNVFTIDQATPKFGEIEVYGGGGKDKFFFQTTFLTMNFGDIDSNDRIIFKTPSDDPKIRVVSSGFIDVHLSSEPAVATETYILSKNVTLYDIKDTDHSNPTSMAEEYSFVPGIEAVDWFLVSFNDPDQANTLHSIIFGNIVSSNFLV